MFGIEIIQAVKFEPITEEMLAKMIREKIAEQHPNVVITDLVFNKPRGGVTVSISGHLEGSEPVENKPKTAKKATKAKAKSEPIDLPEADDVIDPATEKETTVSRDGVADVEDETASIIDEALAEEEEAPLETEPEVVEEEKPKAKSLSEMFQGL